MREVDAAEAMFDDSLAIQSCNIPERCRALGVATSGNGLFAAVTRETLYARSSEPKYGSLLAPFTPGRPLHCKRFCPTHLVSWPTCLVEQLVLDYTIMT